MGKTRTVGNGEGSLYKDSKTGRYIYAYYYNGKRNKIKQKQNEKVSDFKARVTEIKNSVNKNTYIDKDEITLEEIIEKHIEYKHNTGITGDRTYLRNKNSLIHLKKCCNFLQKPIQKITTLDIKEDLPNFTEYAQNTIDKDFLLLKTGFKVSLDDRFIIYNPMNTISKPKSKKQTTPVEALTVDEEKKLIDFLNSTDHEYHNAILLMLYTGIRVGECLALTYDNINLQEGTLTIERTLTRDEYDQVILGSKTKTRAGKRTIILSSPALEIAKKIMSEDKIKNIYNLIFYKEGFIHPGTINSYLKRVNASHHIAPKLHNHMLRHTFATRCIEAGMSGKVLQTILGHTEISTTLDTYASVFDKFKINENDKFEQYMKSLGL
jgi:integrase